MRTAAFAILALSTWLGACRSVRPRVPAPSAIAEPLSVVDLPGEERPTGIQVLGDHGFVVSYRLGSEGGLRFRTLRGEAGARADVGPETYDGGEGVALSPDGAHAAVALFDRVQIVPLADGAPRLLTLRGASSLEYCGAPWDLVWGRPGAQGTLALRCALGRPIALVQVDTGRLTFPPLDADTLDASSTVRDLALSRDGDTLVLVGETTRYEDNSTTAWVELRALSDGSPRRRFTLSRSFGDAALSPDNTRLAVSSPYWGLQILEVASGRVTAEFSDPPNQDNAGSGDVVWSPDGALLYRVGRRLGIAVHDGATAQLRGYFPAHARDATDGGAAESASRAEHNGDLTLSPDGRYLVALSREDIGPGRARAVHIWQLPARAPR